MKDTHVHLSQTSRQTMSETMGATMQTYDKDTIADICGQDTLKIAAVQKFLLRTYPDITRAKDAPLSVSEISAVMSAPALSRTGSIQTTKVKRVTRHTGAELKAAPAPPVSDTPKDVPNVSETNVQDTPPQDRTFLEGLLGAIVLGHALMIWYDCKAQWDVTGMIGGALSFMIVLAALILSADKTKGRTSETALVFVALVDVLAIFVHQPTFEDSAKIGHIETWVFAVFLASVSWVALYLFRDYNQD